MMRNLSIHLFLLYTLLVSGQELPQTLTRAAPTPTSPTLEHRAGTVVLVTVTVTPSSVPDSPSYTSPAVFESDVLNQTNYYRRQHNASALTWNETLATYAKQWAALCNWKHSVCFSSIVLFGCYPIAKPGMKYKREAPTAKTSLKGTQTSHPLLMHGPSKARTTNTPLLRDSVKRRAILRSLSGKLRRMSDVVLRIVRLIVTVVVGKRLDGFWCASIGLQGMLLVIIMSISRKMLIRRSHWEWV